MKKLLFVIGLALAFTGASCAQQLAKDDQAVPPKVEIGDKEAGTEEKTGLREYGEGYRFDENGWIYVHIEGEPYERGKQHGYLVADELAELMRVLKFVTYWDTGMEWDFWVQSAQDMWKDRIDEEMKQEMQGIADGATEAGTPMTYEDVLAWNGSCELTDYWWPTAEANVYAEQPAPDKDHCSAFMATGGATADGKIVAGHNSWTDFATGQYQNLVLDIKPAQGHHIFMQSVPGLIDSTTDFFVTDAGLIGTETTIGGFTAYAANEEPEFYRARKAMQYSNNLDDFVKLMEKKNDGGVANSWLVGDINTNEIMRLELGLKFQSVDRTKDGYYIGFNAPIDPKIRNLEASNTGFGDLRRHQGSRMVRLTQLMEENYGEIDAETGKDILADHYDVYLDKENNPCSRTIDGHYELDDRAFMSQPGRPIPYAPHGTVDGKVVDTDMAKNMSFWARFGNSSGMPFDASEFLEEHIQWDYLDGYLIDRPSQPWTEFAAGEK